jgi:hypothetical protein
VLKPLNKFDNPIGEFTVKAEPVVTVIESKTPAVAAEKNNDSKKKITA